MIRIRRRSLPREAREGLASYQAEIDAIASYPPEVELAKIPFPAATMPDEPRFACRP